MARQPTWGNIDQRIGADLYGADLRDAQGISVSQVQDAKNWNSAFYSEDFLGKLGLDPDHNETLRQELDKMN